MYTPAIAHDNRDFWMVLVADGRPLLAFVGLSLILSGGFALYLALTGQFLPHDLAYLGMDAEQLWGLQNGRVVGFMMHDRGAFGGALIAIGMMYLWLVLFPLKAGEAWAWNTLLVSGVFGFGSFLAYLQFGYLDVWHGVASLLLLPCYVLGMVLTRRLLTASPPSIPFLPSLRDRWRTATGKGQLALLLTGIGLAGAGMVILTVGSSVVFVPQDLHFLHTHAPALDTLNPRLIPLIAHDRSGFGGAILTIGIAFIMSVWYGRPSRSLWQTWFVAGMIGFGCAIFVHPLIGYLDVVHLAPAIAGWGLFLAGMGLTKATYVDGKAN